MAIMPRLTKQLLVAAGIMSDDPLKVDISQILWVEVSGWKCGRAMLFNWAHLASASQRKSQVPSLDWTEQQPAVVF